MDSKTTYVVAWTGGYESPSYKACDTWAEAEALAADWEKSASEDHFIDILLVPHNVKDGPIELRPYVERSD